MSALSALNTASQGMSAQQRALDAVSQNIANVNTEGYSRQRVDLKSMGASTVPAIWSTSNAVGGGVDADSVQRIRDSFAESKALTEHASSARLTAETDAYTSIEAAFREPGDTGLQSTMDEMWSSWEDLGNSTDESAARQAVLENLGKVVGSLQSTRSSLDSQWTQTRDDLDSLVQDSNATIEQIASLNSSIQRASQAGLNSNELADKRDSLVLSLAESLGATASTGSNGMVDVTVGGVTLVSGSTTTRLELTGASDADELASRPLAVTTSPGGTTVSLGGTAGGEMNVLTTIIPRYRDAIDGVAADLAAALNAAHQAVDPATGTPTSSDLNGDAGGALLGSSDGGPVTAANISVLVSDPAKLAAGLTTGTASTDNSNAQAIARLGETSGVNADYRTMITRLGVESSVSSRNLEIQTTITDNVDTTRQSVSGVSLDEEMTNMLSFQNGYEAAARMVTAIDEVLDTLINKTGIVGR